jgi:hypothetical protein
MMPNKLSDVKMRKTLTEYKAVLAVVEKIAQEKNMSTMEFMREGIRNEIRKYAANQHKNEAISNILKNFEPILEHKCSSPAELAKFKRKQRDFDSLMLDLKLKTPNNIEDTNSVVPPSAQIKVLEFGEHHA